MALAVGEDCIGCGACDYACPTGALHKTDSFLGVFAIDPYTCDDCLLCVDKCPVDCIRPDPEWPVCHGRGCPLTSRRLAALECAVWQQTCPDCGDTLWRVSGEKWSCSRCDMGMRVVCPKLHKLSAPAVA